MRALLSFRLLYFLFLSAVAMTPALAQDRFPPPGESQPVMQRQPAQAQPATTPSKAMLSPGDSAELQDFGVTPTTKLHAGPMHGPTPTSIPGGRLTTTSELSNALRQTNSGILIFHVLGGREYIPNAQYAAPASTPGSFTDDTQRRFTQYLNQTTGGRKDAPLVFYCASVQCWMSYNAALRAINGGFTNVRWYRGGLEAWKAAGLPTQSQ